MKNPQHKSLKPTKEKRIEFNVDYQQDTDFSAYARLLQSQWREKKGYPQAKSKLGNYLDIDFAITTRANFLTDNIRNLVTQEVNNAKHTGALISEPRIWNNLLSSQPLCFNLFGELYFDLNLATCFFQHLFPSRIDKVTAVKFEYSPGRRNFRYTGDRSAFDAFVEYTKDGKKGFIGIEVKYAENLRESVKNNADKNDKEQEKAQHYEKLTNSCGLFKNNSIEFLQQSPIVQIWRDHLLSIATKKDYSEGFFVFLFPRNNKECQEGVENYQQYLLSDNEEQNGFYPRYLEDFIQALSALSEAEWIDELKQRYLGEE